MTSATGSLPLPLMLMLLLRVHEARPDMIESVDNGFPWRYNGFDHFPAMYFGANETGMENSEELSLISKHQLSGWGWQVEQCGDGTAGSGADGWCFGKHQNLDAKCFATGTRCDNLTFDESVASFNDAKQLQQHLKDHGGHTDGVFVYRQANIANWWYEIAGRTAFDEHPEYFHAADDGRLCWRDGPFWNFAESTGQATEYWLNTTISELCAQAAAGAISAVFFGIWHLVIRIVSSMLMFGSLDDPHCSQILSIKCREASDISAVVACAAVKTVWMTQVR